MIVMLESKAIFPQLPNEADKVSRKSKEFETRFSRTVFETKQQVTILSALLEFTALLAGGEFMQCTRGSWTATPALIKVHERERN